MLMSVHVWLVTRARGVILTLMSVLHHPASMELVMLVETYNLYYSTSNVRLSACV